MYDKDVIDEDVLYAWFDNPAAAKKFGVSAEDAKGLREKAFKFVDWLRCESHIHSFIPSFFFVCAPAALSTCSGGGWWWRSAVTRLHRGTGWGSSSALWVGALRVLLPACVRALKQRALSVGVDPPCSSQERGRGRRRRVRSVAKAALRAAAGHQHMREGMGAAYLCLFVLQMRSRVDRS